MKIYITQNSEGKFGKGNDWVDKIEHARHTPKYGVAQAQCTRFFKKHPEQECPKILEFDLNIANAKVISVTEKVSKLIDRSKNREQKEKEIRDAQITIYVNGRSYPCDKQICATIDYETLAMIAHPHNNQKKLLTATYFCPKNGIGGTLQPSQFVEMQDGMVFTIVNTSRA